MTTSYYNENDPFAASWLRELIKAGHIAPGEVDERSIEDVIPTDLRGFTQCHFFAGIGVWSYALRCAEWPDDRPVWTGSCPCQPFSAAGKRKGTIDERHLWPAWFHLIEQCSPSVVFGEQVDAAIRQGWLDLVQSDLEGIGYSVGPQGLAACTVGAPHMCKRLYFVAQGGLAVSNMHEHGNKKHGENGDSSKVSREHRAKVSSSGEFGRASPSVHTFWDNAEWLYCRDEKHRPVEPGTFPLAHGVTARMGRLRGYGNALVAPVAQAFIEVFMENEEQDD